MVISLDKTLLINKETEKEHLARCSKWEGVGKVMAGHHITTQMGKKEGRLSMCVFFFNMEATEESCHGRRYTEG